MSERYELAILVHQYLLAQKSSYEIADALLAAGYRRIPDDCVVVLREDASVIAEHWLFDVDEHFQPYDEDRDKAIHARLVEAITDQSGGNND